LAASSMVRLNSTVMALSPLGKRRGGADVAAMASKLFNQGHAVARFAAKWNSLHANRLGKSSCKFNKLIRIPLIRCDDDDKQRSLPYRR
jgi:hypothetical protein